MRFTKRFLRRKNGSGPVPTIGSDGTAGATNPPTEPPGSRDNLLSVKPYSNQGWPGHRVAVAYASTSGAAGTALPCEAWIYDHLTEKWYLVDSKNLVFNAVTFFDVVALLDSAITQASLGEPASGAIEVFFKIQDNALPDGEYTFAVGADLTPLAV